VLAIVLHFVYRQSQNLAWNILRPAPIEDFYKSIEPDGYLRYPVVLYYALTAGFTEEIFFRALPLLYFRERFGNGKPVWWYVVITSILFAVAHWENGSDEVVATFAFGVLVSVAYLRGRSIWPVVGAHTLIDFWYLM
jgi:membrane protease YdiL (CAAX protease family)